MKEVQYIDPDFLKPKDAWEGLSMNDKAAMMRVAIRNGITNLNEIREKYNEFAEGGSFTSLPDNWTMEQEARYQQWREALPENLKDTDDALYDMRRAFVTGIPPTLESDGYYHLGSRDPETGRILKAPQHPTYLQAIVDDAQLGYYPTVDNKGVTYTNTWDANRRLIEEPNLFKKGGYKPSESIKKRIAKMEGKAMTGAIDPLSGKYSKNRSFEAEASSFYHALPDSIRSQVLSNPELADNLFSYSYNVGAGNFRKRVVPALERYYSGNGSAEEIAGSMWASGDKKLRGLKNRRAIEKSGILNALTPTFMPAPIYDTVYFNPFVQPELPIVSEAVLEEAAPVVESPVVEQIEKPVDPLGLLASYTQLLDSSVPQNEPEPVYMPVNAPYVVRRLGGPIVEEGLKRLYQGGGKVKYGQRYYDYSRPGHPITINALMDDVVIRPEKYKAPGERAEDAQKRRNYHDATFGKGTYDAEEDRELTGLQRLMAQREWENSIGKKVLDYAQSAATGIGIGADIVSGLPIYSSLKGVSVLDRAETPVDYVEGGIWLAPLLGGAYQTAKSAIKGVTSTKVPELLTFGNVEDGTFKFTGFEEDPIQMHLKRAQAKGYDTSGIKVYDLSKDTPENSALIENIAKQYEKTPEFTKTFLLNHLGSYGHAANLNGTRIIIHDGIGDNMNATISHEIDHLLHKPEIAIPEGSYYPRMFKRPDKYFTKLNNTELSARGSQLHDYFGHTGNEPITEDMLEYAKHHYIQDTGIDNDMHDFLWTIKDPRKVAEWLTKYATGIAPFGIFGNIENEE